MQLSREDVAEIINNIRGYIRENKTILGQLELDDEMQGRNLIYGISNGFLSQLMETITGVVVEVEGDVEGLYKCPCCGYKTLNEQYDIIKGTGYEICPYCGWEDDGTTDIEVNTSINKGSIREYRERMESNKNKYYINKWL